MEKPKNSIYDPWTWTKWGGGLLEVIGVMGGTGQKGKDGTTVI